MRSEPRLRINATRSDNEDLLAYKVTIMDGEELVNSEEDLLEYIKNTVPYQRGIVSTEQISSNLWIIYNSK